MSGFSIDKSTTISVSLVITLIVVAFFAASLNATTERNTKDIEGIYAKLDTYSDNLAQTNENIVELNARLDSLLASKSSSQTASEQSGAPSQRPVEVLTTPPNVTIVAPPQVDPEKNPGQNPQPEQPSQGLVDQVIAAVARILGGN